MPGWDYQELTAPLNDTRVDAINHQIGVIDQLPILTFDAPEEQLVDDLYKRIQDSQAYWDKPDGFNLNASRQQSKRLHNGMQIDATKLYRFQVPYVENEIFVATETIIAYLTSQQPQPEVYPSQDNLQSRKFAVDLEKALTAHSQKFELSRKMEASVRNLLLKRIGVIKLRFDPDHGEHGEIIPEIIDPEMLVIDKNAVQDGNPAFISHTLKFSVEELFAKFPDKIDAIKKDLGLGDEFSRRMTEMVTVREIWFTHYDEGEAQEAVIWLMDHIVLDKMKNPNWLYNHYNFLDMPKKPFIPLNYVNDGSHWIDFTTPVEQASNMQNILNKRGRQIMESADKANGILVISTDSGLSKDDAQNLTGDPNMKLIIKTAGQPVNSLIYNVPGRDLPSYVIDDKLDARQTIHNIMGTPPQMTGNDTGGSSGKTLGETLMMKNQATGRQDLIVRAIDAFMFKYFNMLVQMMLVWYTDKHFFVYNGGDGDFDYITLHRDLIQKGMQVSVKSGTTLPFDKSRQEAVALQLAKMQMIDPYNLYRDLHMDSAQKRYDAWYKWKTNPQALARETEDEVAETKAYVEFVEVMSGKKVEPAEDASKEHILSHRKQMLTDQFMKGEVKEQKAFLDLIDKELQSLELRTSLDMMSSMSPELLNPKVPIQPMQPPQPPQPMQPPMPGQPPQGQPPQQPQPGQPPMGPPPPPPSAPMGQLQTPESPTMQPSGRPDNLPSI